MNHLNKLSGTIDVEYTQVLENNINSTQSYYAKDISALSEKVNQSLVLATAVEWEEFEGTKTCIVLRFETKALDYDAQMAYYQLRFYLENAVQVYKLKKLVINKLVKPGGIHKKAADMFKEQAIQDSQELTIIKKLKEYTGDKPLTEFTEKELADEISHLLYTPARASG